MCELIFFLLALASNAASITTVATTATEEVRKSNCSNEEWACDDGTCVSKIDVRDGSSSCSGHSNTLNFFCDRSQHQCQDGSCVPLADRCNGVRDCADGGDELQEFCHTKTEAKILRCELPPPPPHGSYSIVSTTGLGSNEKDESPADDAPSLRHNLLSANTEVTSTGGDVVPPDSNVVFSDNDVISAENDVISAENDVISADSDAVSAVELKVTCDPGYGPSATKAPVCFNGVWSEKIPTCVRHCRLKKDPSVQYFCLSHTTGESKKRRWSRECDHVEPQGAVVKPQCRTGFFFPTKHVHMTCHDGQWSYIARCIPEPDEACARTSRASVTVALVMTCRLGHDAAGRGRRICSNGVWSGGIVDCMPGSSRFMRSQAPWRFGDNGRNASAQSSNFCPLGHNPSVNYLCLLSPDSPNTRKCNSIEPSGTIVKPQCNVPSFYARGVLEPMVCLAGRWNYVARCLPECGLVTPKGLPLVIGGRPAELAELPWHTAVYRKEKEDWNQICGGSLISRRVVISAGHCFLKRGVDIQPASTFAVAVGKLYRGWDDPRDELVQKSELSDLVFPKMFQGSLANFQEDIALLLLKETIVYKKHIRPICLDFDPVFEKRQLRRGNFGKVAGWGYTSENGGSAERLQALEVPYVPGEACVRAAARAYRAALTGDKICAGYLNGKALCRGDSGGGLVFPQKQLNTLYKARYFLRGVASGGEQRDLALCNSKWFNTYTAISRHQHFIQDSLKKWHVSN